MNDPPSPDSRLPVTAAIGKRIDESLKVLLQLSEMATLLADIANRITRCFERGGTLYLCGNGGSAADAQHVAAEFVGRFLKERRALPAIALTCNTSILTAIGNDYDFSLVFARQVRATVKPQDCVVGISTSGQSANVIEAMRAARELGAETIGFTGESGGALSPLCDACFCAPSPHTPRIQEAHLLAWHAICQSVEEAVCDLHADRSPPKQP